VYASKIEVRITPFQKGQDQFSMLRNNYNRNLVATFNNETGVLEIVHNGAPVTEEDWQTVLNYPTYLLYIRRRLPRSCYLFTDGKYERTITMQVTDRYGRKSNVMTRNLFVKTCLVMFSSDKPVKVTNDAAWFQYEFTEDYFDPVDNQYLDITGTPD